MDVTPLLHINLLLHLAATFYMLGVIWFVQCVHYPLFASVGAPHFVDYERQHMARTTPIVAIAMGAELLTGVILVAVPTPGLASWIPSAGLGLLLVIWVSTALLQVPRHARLSRGFEPGLHRALVASNWVRTAAWTLRAILLLLLLLPRPITAVAATPAIAV